MLPVPSCKSCRAEANVKTENKEKECAGLMESLVPRTVRGRDRDTERERERDRESPSSQKNTNLNIVLAK